MRTHQIFITSFLSNLFKLIFLWNYLSHFTYFLNLVSFNDAIVFFVGVESGHLEGVEFFVLAGSIGDFTTRGGTGACEREFRRLVFRSVLGILYKNTVYECRCHGWLDLISTGPSSIIIYFLIRWNDQKIIISWCVY